MDISAFRGTEILNPKPTGQEYVANAAGALWMECRLPWSKPQSCSSAATVITCCGGRSSTRRRCAYEPGYLGRLEMPASPGSTMEEFLFRNVQLDSIRASWISRLSAWMRPSLVLLFQMDRARSGTHLHRMATLCSRAKSPGKQRRRPSHKTHYSY